MPLILAPSTAIGTKPRPGTWRGPASVPGDWWKDLKMCLPYWSGAGPARELVHNLGATTVVESAGTGWTNEGWNKQTSTNEQSFADITAGDYALPASDMTFFIHVNKTGNAGASQSHFSYRTGATYGAWGPQESGGHYRFLWYDSGDATNYAQFNFAWNNYVGTNEEQTLVFRCKGSLITEGNWDFWYNGRRVLGASNSSLTNAPDGGADNHEIATGQLGSGGSNSVQGEYRAAYMWHRALSDAELMYLMNVDPYAPVRSYNIIGAAEGGDTILTQTTPVLLTMGFPTATATSVGSAGDISFRSALRHGGINIGF